MDKAILGILGPPGPRKSSGPGARRLVSGAGARGGGGEGRERREVVRFIGNQKPKSVNPAFFSTFLYGPYMMTDSCRPYLWPKRPTFVRNYTERNYNEEGLFGNRVSKPPNKANVKTPVPMASRHGECRKGTFNPT